MKKVTVEELLAKAQQPSLDAPRLHKFYKGKMGTALKCRIRDFNDFAIWYTPGVAAVCKEIAVDKQTHITVTGVDRQLVGQVAANIRRMRKPDPYKQKGVRYTGEVLKKKVGKTGA